MQTLKIATWNVNSLRVRLAQVVAWLEQVKPDVLALQEIKLTDADFPIEAIRAAGYEAVFAGQKTYNGVAILSRQKASEIVTDFHSLTDTQRRVLAVTVGQIRILNLYVPNGERVQSEKYQYKLNWLQHLDLFLKQEIQRHPQMVIVGDFNIAPEEIDVHDPQRWDGQVLFSQPERQAFKEILEIGFMDCFRHTNPQEQSFSWWDYRMNAFKRNMGLRIDHILASSALVSQCSACQIDKTPRLAERPSDHAPVIAEFKLD
jgi:exodeoxyribonuclease-3